MLLALALGCSKDDSGCYVCEEYYPIRIELIPTNWTWEELEDYDIEGWEMLYKEIYCGELPEDGYQSNGYRAPVKYECESIKL